MGRMSTSAPSELDTALAEFGSDSCSDDWGTASEDDTDPNRTSLASKPT